MVSFGGTSGTSPGLSFKCLPTYLILTYLTNYESEIYGLKQSAHALADPAAGAA